MHLSDFDFPFDPTLVASRPVVPRDRARLLVLNRQDGRAAHRQVLELPDLLDPGDLVVANDTRVLAARVVGRKQPGGRAVEVLFVRDLGTGVWEVLIKGRFRVGQIIEFGSDSRATIVKRDATGTLVRMDGGIPVMQLLREQGTMPLPPYIKRPATQEDHRWYQTIFAKQEGSIAAPTAGLHFTEELLARLDRRGVRLATVTLHVGPGTFQPVATERIEDHRIGEEVFHIGEEAANAVAQAKQTGRRVVAVGTTVVRALETAATTAGRVLPMSGESRLFITPGFRFKVVDALMTNFHLPRTTLLMLVSAFAGLELVRQAYVEAIKERYRFYSYGDAMLIL